MINSVGKDSHNRTVMSIYRIHINNRIKWFIGFIAVATISISYLNVYGVPNYTSFTNAINHSNIEAPNGYINIIKPTRKENNFQKGSLRSGSGAVIIYVYNKNDMISNSILLYGIWESWLVNAFSMYIRNHPGIQILDAGCNIGVYTLTAASLGSNVVCIDANYNNTDRVAQAVLDNGFVNKVTILLNAITNTRKEFVMTKNDRNIGSQNILENKDHPRRVKGIFIDDLLPLFDPNREVIIKMDIEGTEIEAIQKADQFFDKRNVKLVMMEWEWIMKSINIKYLLEFFTLRKFKPFKSLTKVEPLALDKYLEWPIDIAWIKM